MATNYFLDTLRNLREHEEVLLFGNILNISEDDTADTMEFLRAEYRNESLEYPYEVPPFDSAVALWAAKTVYLAAQLLLYRENKSADLESLLPDFNGELNSSTILSCDLCLRFLPGIIIQLKLIDSEDKLIQVLEQKLTVWHYSGITYPLEIDKLDFQITTSDECLKQLYIDRIIANRKIHLAKHLAYKDGVAASMGIFANEFWNEFKLETSIDGNH